MNVLNQEHIKELLDHRSPICVSLFMPTHRTGRDRPQDLIRLKNLIKEAHQRTTEFESTSQAERVLQGLNDLRSDDVFWQHRSDGLACFSALDFFRAYRVPIKLDENLYVSERFHIRPLLPLLRSDARVCVLALTLESARLFEASRYSIRAVDLPDIAQGDSNGDQQSLQYHALKMPAQGRGDTATVIYHGLGGPADQAKKDALKFFQAVDRAVTRTLRGQRSPLVLACVGYLAALYESANNYRHLLKGKIPGSPERWSEEELLDHAWQIAEPHFRQDRQVAWRQFQQANGTGRTANELRSVVLAADEGRIDTLFLVRGEKRWGHIDTSLGAVQLCEAEAGGQELLDFAATRTLSNGGDVLLLDALPNLQSPAAAMLRY